MVEAPTPPFKELPMSHDQNESRRVRKALRKARVLWLPAIFVIVPWISVDLYQSSQSSSAKAETRRAAVAEPLAWFLYDDSGLKEVYGVEVRIPAAHGRVKSLTATLMLRNELSVAAGDRVALLCSRVAVGDLEWRCLTPRGRRYEQREINTASVVFEDDAGEHWGGRVMYATPPDPKEPLFVRESVYHVNPANPSQVRGLNITVDAAGPVKKVEVSAEIAAKGGVERYSGSSFVVDLRCTRLTVDMGSEPYSGESYRIETWRCLAAGGTAYEDRRFLRLSVRFRDTAGWHRQELFNRLACYPYSPHSPC
jgi:hypothetical protein